MSSIKDTPFGNVVLSHIISIIYEQYRLAFGLPSPQQSFKTSAPAKSGRYDGLRVRQKPDITPEEGNMLKKVFVLASALAMSANVVLASTGGQRKDLQVFNDIAKSVNRYAYFTILDDVDVAVKDGVVTLSGKVTMPYKSQDIEKRVAKVDGVSEVLNRISVLPVSQFDDQLRYRIARSIYGSGHFANYSRVNPPIHVIVDHGRVTLTGVVNSEVDRMLARSLATQFGAFSVTNNLKTDAEVREALEKS